MTRGAIGRRLGPAAVSWVVTTVAVAVLPGLAPGRARRWERTNYAGRPVSLLGGPAVVAGLTAGVLSAAGPRPATRCGLAVVAIGVGAVGAYDDLRGGSATKGFRGHLRALRHGRVTSGSVKLAAIGAAGLAGAGLLRAESGAPRVCLAALRDSVVVAGSANLVNLFDLRPGRALKVSIAATACGVATAGGSLAAAVAGSSVAALPGDLAARIMLGDCGANALGALAGCSAVAGASPAARTSIAIAVTALTLASERHSFSEVIAGQPLLRRLDMWGRAAEAGRIGEAGKT